MLQQTINTIKQKKLAKETIWSFATKGSTMVLFFGIDIILARSLGDQYGSWAYFFSALTIIILLSTFGVNSAMRAYAAKYNNTPSLRTVLRSGLTLRIGLSLLVVLIVLVGRDLIADIFDREYFSTLLLLSIPLLLFTNAVEFCKQLFSGLHRIKFAFITNTSEYGSKFALVLLIALVPTVLASVESTIYAYTAGVILATLASSYVAVRYIKSQPNEEANQPTTADRIKEMAAYSMPLFVISIGLIVATEVDTVLLGRLQGDEAAGIYSVAKKIITKLPQISLAISAGTMPIFAKMTANTVKKDKALFYKLLKINTAIFLPLAVVILSTSWFFIPLFYGEAYTASVLPLNILLVYLLVYSYSIYLSIFLDYRKLARKRAINLSIAIILNIVLDLALIPQYGPAGAAFATSVSYIPYLLLNWREVHLEFKRLAHSTGK